MTVTVVAMPVSAKSATIVAGSGRANCAECSAEVHVAPSTANLICENPGTAWEFKCIECAAKQIEALPPEEKVQFMAPMPEQIAELMEAQR
jgi:hypothetical protein